jgi:hypothetical protein
LPNHATRFPRKHSAKKEKSRFDDAKAAKFREETPRKGGGFADGSAIPRCNNMMEHAGYSKPEIAFTSEYFPAKPVYFTRAGWIFWASAQESGDCAAQYQAETNPLPQPA